MTPPPAALRPLIAVLAVLDEPARGALMELARRLDALFGPVRPRQLARGGAPNGFRGLTRRGPYDRLLLSEWALLDEAPDEFLRRAVAGEHAFYELDTREPATGLRLRAVFDAGPEQLGAPRIAHLAVLFVLLKRAIAANAELEWSVAQRPGVLHNAVNRDTVGALLGARSNRPFELPDLSGEPPADETWIVGPALAPELAPFRLVQLRERLSADAEEVGVTLHRPARRAVELVLPLPAPKLRARLLTDPFPSMEAGHRPPLPASPTSQPGWRVFPPALRGPVAVRFLEGTAQVAVFFAGGDVLLWSVSKLGTRASPRFRRHLGVRAAERVALGYFHQRPLDVWRDGAQLRAAGAWTAAIGEPTPPPPAGTGGAWVVGGFLYFVDGAGVLWSRVVRGGQLAVVRPGARDALGIDGLTTVVGLGEGGAWVHRHWDSVAAGSPRQTSHRIEPREAGVPIEDVWLARGDRAILTREGGSTWVREGWGREAVAVEGRLSAPGARVLGWLPAAHGPPALLDWVPGTGRFGVGGGEGFVVPRVPLGPTVSADARWVAFLTAERTVELWDAAAGQPRQLCREAP